VQNIQRFYQQPSESAPESTPPAPSFGEKVKRRLKIFNWTRIRDLAASFGENTNGLVLRFNWKLLGELALIGAFVVGVYKLYRSIVKEWEESEQFKRESASKRLLTPIKVEEEADYVVRQDLEALLNDIVGSIRDRKYIILVGQKGSGKTTLLNHVMNGKAGIVPIKIDGKTTLQNLEHRLLDAINVPIESWNQNKAQQVFGEICSSVRRKEGDKVKWVPTVIFEVEGRTPKDIIKELYKTAKQLSSDNVQARCIIVLSDANASLSMTNDSGRQRYIWIPDFTEDEANRYLTKLGFTDDKETRKEVIDKIGTRPVDLRNIASSEMNPKEFIENQISENEKSVENCLIKSQSFRDVFIAMIKEKNGMDESSVKKLCNLTTTDIAEGPAVKEFHVFSYDIQNKKFQFHSRAMYHATKQYLNKSK
jgi:ABC-type oligopeptide transport system ATPase subunit